MMDPLKTDLRLTFASFGQVDLAVQVVDLETVSGLDNLAQALAMRLLVRQGELAGLGHLKYGSRIRSLIGRPMDTANLELLRRYVRRALLDDPRVEEITQLVVRPLPEAPGLVDVSATVNPISGGQVRVGVTLDVG